MERAGLRDEMQMSDMGELEGSHLAEILYDAIVFLADAAWPFRSDAACVPKVVYCLGHWPVVRFEPD